MEQKNELIKLFNYLQIEYDFNLVDMALVFFRKSYQERPYKYPGDNELYNLVKSCILEGRSFKQSIDLTFEIIKREIQMHDLYYRGGYDYQEDFKPPQIELDKNMKAENIIKSMNIKPKYWEKIPILRGIIYFYYKIRYR